MGPDMIKDILVGLPTGASPKAVVDYAVSVAAAFEAHLVGLAFTYEPVVPGTVFDGVAASIIETYRQESEKTGRASIKEFNDAVKRAGLSAESHLLESGTGSSGELFAQFARHFDLCVVAQTDPELDAPEELLPEAALFESGRPVLIVPYIQRSGLDLNRVLVCWDGSRAAARAIGDAMPFLARSKSLEIVTVAKHEEPQDELPGVDIAQHLARHSLKVEFKRMVANDIDVASTILSYAADAGAGMIVMGGYGHSRLREFVLGGATRDILSSMTVPVLMSH
jgi:nucleotide-binding universal stress UspA family protein